jgi:dTMP kinase
MNIKPQKLPGGLLIIFEGIDGTGKSTQLELAAERLRSGGWPVKTSRNLGGTPIGEALREVMLSNFERPAETDLYISVAIQAALIPAIKEGRQAGQIILLDRGPLSLAAYQIYGSGVAGELAWPHVDAGMRSLAPELTVFYDGDVGAMLRRVKQKSTASDHFEAQPVDYFDRVANGYREAIKRFKTPVAAVDANQPIAAVNQATMESIEGVIHTKLKQL